MSGAAAAVTDIVKDPLKAIKNPLNLIAPGLGSQLDIAKGLGKDVGLLPETPTPIAPQALPAPGDAQSAIDEKRRLELAGRKGRASTIRTQPTTLLGGSGVSRTVLGR